MSKLVLNTRPSTDDAAPVLFPEYDDLARRDQADLARFRARELKETSILRQFEELEKATKEDFIAALRLAKGTLPPRARAERILSFVSNHLRHQRNERQSKLS
jgi:hypothetical protein